MRIFKASLELVVIAVQHRRDSIDVLGEHAQVQLGIALLHHATQESRRVDAALRLVDGAAVTPHFGDMAGRAFALGDELFTQFVVGILEDGGLGMGPTRTQDTKSY